MLGIRQGGKIARDPPGQGKLQLVDSILGVVHLYAQVVDFSEKVVDLFAVPHGEVTLEALDPVRFGSPPSRRPSFISSLFSLTPPPLPCCHFYHLLLYPRSSFTLSIPASPSSSFSFPSDPF